MDEVSKKRFKEPREYYWSFVLYFLITIFGLWLIINLVFYETEAELYDEFADRKLIGNARQRSAIMIASFLIKYFGKEGFVIALTLCFIAAIYEFYKTIAEYLRYKRKCKLYQEGLIKNVYDIYDDYVPLLSWRRIKTLFSTKEKTHKKKYPSKREMKKQIKEWKNR